MNTTAHTKPEALIIGGGPAGLAAAIELKRRGLDEVLVLERERTAGGIPRHCFHTGFGFFDRHRVLSGPRYAADYVTLARDAGVTIWTEATATSWQEQTVVRITSPQGIQSIQARTVLLATGCRERPRPARLIPGGRPGGVYTTGTLQQMVHLKGRKVGTKAVVVGAEHVSFSAVDTLGKSGCRTVAMVTDYPAHQTYAPFAWWVASRRHVPVLTNTRVLSVNGREHVESVDVLNVRSGDRSTIPCDTVVFTGDWIPEHEVARLGGIAINRATKGPEVDQRLRTTRPGVFAAGNLLRGAEMADVAALEGRYAAEAMLEFLDHPEWPVLENRIPIEVVYPVKWVSPNAIHPGMGKSLPRGRLVFRVDRFISNGTVRLTTGSDELVHKRYHRLVPNQWYGLPLNTLDSRPKTYSLRIDE